MVEFDDWGTRNLAYDIKKKTRGHYVRLDYCGMGQAVNELERFFRIDDRAMKYMNVLLEKNVNEEEIKAQSTKATQEEAKAGATENPEPDGEEKTDAGEAVTEESDSSQADEPESEAPAEQDDDESTETKEEEK